MDEPFTPPRYPALQFLLAHGVKLAWLVGVLTALAGLYFGYTNASLLWAAGGLAGGALLALLLASYVDVLRIVADTLIPH